MEYIAHRINTLEQLQQLPTEYGVELDLRDTGDQLILQHDPFTDGESFEEYLKHYKHGTMILNIKSERIEHRVLELIQKYNIKKYFFLDQSFPMVVTMANEGESNIAIRFSEYERLETILTMKDKIKWVWVDCFHSISQTIDKASYQTIKEAGFQLCLVSPELQGRPDELNECKQYLNENNIIFDAICTKQYNIDHWK